MEQKKVRMKVVFDSSVKNQILDIFDKSIDNEGYIVEKDDLDNRVETPNGEEIPAKRFAGIRRGSEIFLKSDLPTFLELADDQE